MALVEDYATLTTTQEFWDTGLNAMPRQDTPAYLLRDLRFLRPPPLHIPDYKDATKIRCVSASFKEAKYATYPEEGETCVLL
jgi:hypothetical protein